MLLHISRRNYFIIALLVTVVMFLVANFLGPSIITYADTLPASTAEGVRPLASLIVEPIKFVMLNPILGAIISGLLWPVVIFWIGLLLLLIILTAVGQVKTDINTQTPLSG